MPFLTHKGTQITALYADGTELQKIAPPFMQISQEQYTLVCKDPARCYIENGVFRTYEIPVVDTLEKELTALRVEHAEQLGSLEHNKYVYYPTAELLAAMNTTIMLEDGMMITVLVEGKDLCGIYHSYKEVQGVLKDYMKKRNKLVKAEQKLRDSKITEES